jgi:hypothetical protein
MSAGRVPPFVLKDLAEGRLQIIARGSDVEAIRNQTIRVNVANANALKDKCDAFVRYIRVIAALSTGLILATRRSTHTPPSQKYRVTLHNARVTSFIPNSRCSSARSAVST